MQKLEDELECRLFYQSKRSVELTTAGQQLLPFVTCALNQLSCGITKIKQPEELSRKVLINGYSSLSPYITKLIVGFAAFTSNVEIKPQVQYSYEEHLERLLESLLTEQVDFVFSDKIESSSVHSVFVGSRNYSLLVPATHRLSKQKNIQIDDFRDEKIITFPKDCYPGNMVRSCFDRNNSILLISSETTQTPIFYSMIQSGYGLAILPEPLSPKPDGIESIPLSSIIPDQQIYLHWKYDRSLSETQKQFLYYCLERNPGLN